MRLAVLNKNGRRDKAPVRESHLRKTPLNPIEGSRVALHRWCSLLGLFDRSSDSISRKDGSDQRKKKAHRGALLCCCAPFNGRGVSGKRRGGALRGEPPPGF